MKCMYCQGKMEHALAPFHVDRKGYHLVLDAVPAFVCRQCGEVYFAEAEVDSIQETIKAVDLQVEKITLPVYSETPG
jgi:YgiT-type zinc finger domain-containing protein